MGKDHIAIKKESLGDDAIITSDGESMADSEPGGVRINDGYMQDIQAHNPVPQTQANRTEEKAEIARLKQALKASKKANRAATKAAKGAAEPTTSKKTAKAASKKGRKSKRARTLEQRNSTNMKMLKDAVKESRVKLVETIFKKDKTFMMVEV